MPGGPGVFVSDPPLCAPVPPHYDGFGVQLVSFERVAGGRFSLSLSFAALCGCQGAAVFGCDANDQCRQDSAVGTCEVNGFCSFPDPACESGRRYSTLAGSGLAEKCVLEDSGSTGTMTTSGSSSTTNPLTSTTDPTTAPATSSTTTTTTTTTTDPATNSSTASEASDDTAASTSTGEVGLPSEGLVLHFDFEDAFSPDFPVEDVSGNGFLGECPLGRCPQPVPGVVGSGVAFDGVDDYLEVRDDMTFHFGQMSVSMWATSDGGDQVAIVFGKAVLGGDRNSYELYLNSSTDPRQLRWSMDAVQSTEGLVAIEEPFTRTEWVHLVGTWDGSTLEFFVDGAFVGRALNIGTDFDDTPIHIGGDIAQGMPAHPWNGRVDEVRLYSRVLDAAEITALYEQGA